LNNNSSEDNNLLLYYLSMIEYTCRVLPLRVMSDETTTIVREGTKEEEIVVAKPIPMGG